MTRGPALVLVGPPGAGKTTVGRLVAARLGLGFRDTDEDVEQATGQPVPDLFLTVGEPAFRELEKSAVATALAQHSGVLSLGGGAVLSPPTREQLAGRPVVYLAVEATEAARRVGLSAPRPVLGLNPRAMLRTLLAERVPLYLEVAAHQVETTGRAVEEVAGAVLAWLASSAPASAPPSR